MVVVRREIVVLRGGGDLLRRRLASILAVSGALALPASSSAAFNVKIECSYWEQLISCTSGPPGSPMIFSLDTGGSTKYADMAGAVKYVRANDAQAAANATAAQAAGIRFGTVQQGEGGTIGAIEPQAYAAEALADVQAAKPIAFEVLNEPGGSWFWSDPHNFTAYVALLKATHEAFQGIPASERPKILASWDGGAQENWGVGWKALGGLAYVDGVTVHPYSQSGDGNHGDVEQAHRESGLPVWVTEWGKPTVRSSSDTQQVSEEEQAADLTSFAAFCSSLGYVADLTVYVYHDWPGEPGYGIERADGSHKPSFAVLAGLSGL